MQYIFLQNTVFKFVSVIIKVRYQYIIKFKVLTAIKALLKLKISSKFFFRGTYDINF